MNRGAAGGSFTALLAVEVRRLLARRLLRILALLAVVAIAVGCVVVAVRSSAPTAEELAIARHAAERRVAECEAAPGIREHAPDGESVEAYCRALASGEDVLPATTFVLTAVREVLLGLAAAFAILGLLLGATSIGAEWHAGTMTTLLTWEPRRIRVGLAKAASCAAISFLAILGLEVLLGGVLAGVAATRGATLGADGAWLADTLGVAVRAAAIAAAMALVGYSLASIGRNTAAALGAGFAYFAVVEGLIRGLRPQWQPWLLGENSALFIEGGGSSLDLGHSAVAAGALIGVYALGALAIGVGFLRGRDVS